MWWPHKLNNRQKIHSFPFFVSVRDQCPVLTYVAGLCTLSTLWLINSHSIGRITCLHSFNAYSGIFQFRCHLALEFQVSHPQLRITLVLASSQAHDRYWSGGTPWGFLESILYNEPARETLVAYFFYSIHCIKLRILIQWPQVSRAPNLQTDAPLLSRSCVCVCCVCLVSAQALVEH